MSPMDNLTPELLESLRIWMSNEFLMVDQLVPDLPRATQADLDAAIEEHLILAQTVLPAFVDADSVAKYPYMQIIVHHKSEPPDKAIAFSAHKSMGAVDNNTEEATKTALEIAFINSPAARRLLYVQGFRYRLQGVGRLQPKIELVH